jgi:hypothetical protein
MRSLARLHNLLALTAIAVLAAYLSLTAGVREFAGDSRELEYFDVTDAIAREFSVHARHLESFDVTDALAREFSVDVRELQTFEVTDAVAREFSVDVREVEVFVVTDAIAREFTVDARRVEDFAVTDAVAQEFSVFVASPKLTASAIADGGGTLAGDGFTLRGTIGQPDVKKLTADDYILRGGFWPGQDVGDLDGDGDVDLADYEVFENCMTGPGVPKQLGCRAADLDGDGDVDLADYGIFQEILPGSP